MDLRGKVDEAKDRVEDAVKDIALVDTLSEKLNIPKWALVAGAAFLTAAFLFFGFGAGVLCNLVGFVYPAYKSFKAIESHDKDDDTMWLTYWVVYAFFNLVESFSDVILYWIPFYYAAKLGFLIWLFLPSTTGANFVYEHFLRELLKQAEPHVDRALDATADVGSGLAAEGKRLAGHAVGASVASMAAKKNH